MNEWEIKYIYRGEQKDIVKADTLEHAISIWRVWNGRNVPGIGLYSVICVK